MTVLSRHERQSYKLQLLQTSGRRINKDMSITFPGVQFNRNKPQFSQHTPVLVGWLVVFISTCTSESAFISNKLFQRVWRLIRKCFGLYTYAVRTGLNHKVKNDSNEVASFGLTLDCFKGVPHSSHRWIKHAASPPDINAFGEEKYFSPIKS